MKPIGLLVDSIFGTGTVFGERPPLDLRLAWHYVKEERFEDSIDEYERVRGYYPDIPRFTKNPWFCSEKSAPSARKSTNSTATASEKSPKRRPAET